MSGSSSSHLHPPHPLGFLFWHIRICEMWSVHGTPIRCNASPDIAERDSETDSTPSRASRNRDVAPAVGSVPLHVHKTSCQMAYCAGGIDCAVFRGRENSLPGGGGSQGGGGGGASSSSPASCCKCFKREKHQGRNFVSQTCWQMCSTWVTCVCD
jgi:hypothetical protein